MKIAYADIRPVLVLLASLFFIPYAAAEDFNSKILLENHLEERLKSALIEVTGTDKLIVAVSADVEGGKARSSSGPQRKGTLTRKEESNALVLPGVPEKKEIGKSTTQTAELNLPDVPAPSAGGVGSAMVRRLGVTVLLDTGVPASMIEVVRDITIRVADMNPGRGDTLDIKQVSIKKTSFRWASLFYPPHLYWVILIITGGFFLLAASLFMMNPFIKLSGSGQSVKVDVLKDVAAGVLAGGKEAPGEAVEASAPSVAVAQDVTEKKSHPFSFIKEKHFRDLAYLLQNEPAMDIAVIINYLDTDLAIKLLDNFSTDMQAEITVCLSGVAEVTPEKIEAIENKVKDRLGYLVGGEDKVAGILGLVNDEVRDRILGIMEKKDAEAAKRLRQQVKDLDTFMRELSLQGIQALYRQMDHALFAQILKSMPDDITEKVMGTLSAGAAKLLKQEMELSKPLAPARLKKEKHAMMLTIRRMVREGSLELGSN